jgi:glutamyl-tRNA synthetase
MMSEAIELADKAKAQLELDGVTAVLTHVIQQAEAAERFDAEVAQQIINTVTTELNVKKGLVMKSLRAALTGELSGPDLIQSWVVLHQRGLALGRLQAAIG